MEETSQHLAVSILSFFLTKRNLKNAQLKNY